MNTYTKHHHDTALFFSRPAAYLQNRPGVFARVPMGAPLSGVRLCETDECQDCPPVTVSLLVLPSTHITAVTLWKDGGGLVNTHTTLPARGELCLWQTSSMDCITLAAASMEEFNALYRPWFYTLHQKGMAGMLVTAITVDGLEDPGLHTLGWLKCICRSHGIALEIMQA